MAGRKIKIGKNKTEVELKDINGKTGLDFDNGGKLLTTTFLTNSFKE